LLAKESISLPDIVRILGDRPFPLKESIRQYLEELKTRKEQDDEKEEEKKHKEHAEKAANTPADEVPPSGGNQGYDNPGADEGNIKEK
jgi:hypothetical protein